MRQSHFTCPFTYRGQPMRASAYAVDGAWELVIQDRNGRVVCTWRPDRALFQGPRVSSIPLVLQMMAAMAEDGVLALRMPEPAV
ncbi:hypothetical protein [Roseomonas chloroacetimidivorans]|jgi:hypothetical protein|uniref:hypothetical protein n=1 Tax=Roseomonas chloroacetimidivorans TaxID=1766656 RepID=UPI003C70B87D